MITNKKFGDNEFYPRVKKNDNYGEFIDHDGLTRVHKFAKVQFLSKTTSHKAGSKNVVCKLHCFINFDIPMYWETDLTRFTDFEVVGVAVCADDDEFDLNKGKLIAQAKAENEAYKVAARMMVTLQKQLTNFANALDTPIANLGDYVEHNEKFIEKVIDGEIKPKR